MRFIPVLHAVCSLVGIAGLVQAQSFLETNGQLVAVSGAPTPGVAGATWAGDGAFDLPQIDESGSVYFRGQFTGTGVTSANNRAMFHGPPGGLTIGTRGGDPAPGLPAGVTVSTLAGASGLTSNFRLSPSGACVWLTWVGNGGSTPTSDTAIYGGTPAVPVLLGREGGPAPGTIGATLSTNFASTLSMNLFAVTSNGNVCWRSQLTGGDVVGSTNNEALYVYNAGTSTSQIVIRRGDPILGGSSIALLNTPSLPYGLQINASGQILWDGVLSTTIGSPPATSADDQVLVLSSSSGAHTVIAREGDAAPGAAGVLYGHSVGNMAWGTTDNCLTSGGDILFKAELRGPGTTPGVDDQGMFRKPAGGPVSMLYRRGDPAPGAPGTAIAWVTGPQANINASGQFIVPLLLSGATVADDSGLWWGNLHTPGPLTLLAREGDLAPGTSGARFGPVTSVMQNDSGTAIIQFPLTGGDVVGTTNSDALYRWTPATGLQMLVRSGETWSALPGETISSFGLNALSDTGGTNVGFSQTGKLVVRLGLVSTNQAIAVIDAGATPYTTFCTGGAVGTTCLGCGNNGAAERGCANSLFATGTRLTSSGSASITSDTLVLTTTDMPGPGLFFQSNGLFGTPVAFGDGMLCAAVGILRLGVVFPSPTFTASYPGGLTPFPISVVGGPIGAGDLKHYQCWYRDAAAFCTIDTFNTSNGVSLSWGP